MQGNSRPTHPKRKVQDTIRKLQETTSESLGQNPFQKEIDAIAEHHERYSHMLPIKSATFIHVSCSVTTAVLIP